MSLVRAVPDNDVLLGDSGEQGASARNAIISDIYEAVGQTRFASVQTVPTVQEVLFGRAYSIAPRSQLLSYGPDIPEAPADDVNSSIDELLAAVDHGIENNAYPFWSSLMRVPPGSHADVRTPQPIKYTGLDVLTPPLTATSSKALNFAFDDDEGNESMAESIYSAEGLETIIDSVVDGNAQFAELKFGTLEQIVQYHLNGGAVSDAFLQQIANRPLSKLPGTALMAMYLAVCAKSCNSPLSQCLQRVTELWPVASSENALHPAVFERCVSCLSARLFCNTSVTICEVQCISLASVVFESCREKPMPTSVLDLLCRLAQVPGPIRSHLTELMFAPSVNTTALPLRWTVAGQNCTAFAYALCLDATLQLESRSWNALDLQPHAQALFSCSSGPGQQNEVFVRQVLPEVVRMCSLLHWIGAAVLLRSIHISAMRALVSNKTAVPEARSLYIETLGCTAKFLRTLELRLGSDARSFSYDCNAVTEQWEYIDSSRLCSALEQICPLQRVVKKGRAAFIDNLNSSPLKSLNIATDAVASHIGKMDEGQLFQYHASIVNMFKSIGAGSEKAVALLLQLASAGSSVSVRSRSLRDLVRILDGPADPLLSNDPFVFALLKYGQDSFPMMRDASIEAISLILGAAACLDMPVDASIFAKRPPITVSQELVLSTRSVAKIGLEENSDINSPARDTTMRCKSTPDSSLCIQSPRQICSQSALDNCKADGTQRLSLSSAFTASAHAPEKVDAKSDVANASTLSAVSLQCVKAALDALVSRINDTSTAVRKHAVKAASDLLQNRSIVVQPDQLAILRGALSVCASTSDDASTALAMDTLMQHWILPMLNACAVAQASNNSVEWRQSVVNFANDIRSIVVWADKCDRLDAIKKVMKQAVALNGATTDLLCNASDLMFDALAAELGRNKPSPDTENPDREIYESQSPTVQRPVQASTENAKSIVATLAVFFDSDAIESSRLALHFRLLCDLIELDDSSLVMQALLLMRMALRYECRFLYRQVPELPSTLTRLILRGSEGIVRVAIETLCDLVVANTSVLSQLVSMYKRFLSYCLDKLGIADNGQMLPSSTDSPGLPSIVKRNGNESVASSHTNLLSRSSNSSTDSSLDSRLPFLKAAPPCTNTPNPKPQSQDMSIWRTCSPQPLSANVTAALCRALYSLGVLYKEGTLRSWATEYESEWTLSATQILPVALACLESYSLYGDKAETLSVFAVMAAAEMVVADPLLAASDGLFEMHVVSAALSSKSVLTRTAVVRGFQQCIDRVMSSQSESSFGASHANTDYSAKACGLFQAHAKQIASACVFTSNNALKNTTADSQSSVLSKTNNTAGTSRSAFVAALECAPVSDTTFAVLRLLDGTSTLLAHMLKTGVAHPGIVIPSLLALWNAVPDPNTPFAEQMPFSFTSSIYSMNKRISDFCTDMIATHESFLSISLVESVRQTCLMLCPGSVGSRLVTLDDAPELSVRSVFHRAFEGVRTRSRRIEFLDAIFTEMRMLLGNSSHVSKPNADGKGAVTGLGSTSISISNSQSLASSYQSSNDNAQALFECKDTQVEQGVKYGLNNTDYPTCALMDKQSESDQVLCRLKFLGEALATLSYNGIEEVAHAIRRINEIASLYDDSDLMLDEGDTFGGVGPTALLGANPKSMYDEGQTSNVNAGCHEQTADDNLRTRLMQHVVVLRVLGFISQNYRVTLSQAENLTKPTGRKLSPSVDVGALWRADGGPGVLKYSGATSVAALRAEAAALAQGAVDFSAAYRVAGVPKRPRASMGAHAQPAPKRKRVQKPRKLEGVVSDASESVSSSSEDDM